MIDAAFTLLNQPGVSTCIASTTARTHAPDLTWWIGPGVPQWRAEPDTWGSDHMPIKIGLHSACLKKIRRRVTVTHWDKLREVSATMIPTDPTELLPALQQLLRDSIITTTVDEDQPQPDLTLLQLWAKRRQADVAASRNPTTPGGRSCVNHLAAEARRHEKQLSRQRWYEWCDSLGTGTGNKALWRTYHSMERGGKQPDPAACVRLALQTTPKDFATYAARTFFPKYDQTSPIQCPDIDESDSSSQANISSLFNMAELIAAIETAKKRTTPGHDGVPTEVFQNLEGPALDTLLEAINQVWETGDIPSDWKHSIVVSIPKPGKTPNNLQALRPISLTPTICKLVERMLATRVSWWLERYGKYHPAQIGFRPYLGTEEGLSILADDIIQVSPHSQAVRTVVALDIAKAYDNIDHRVIMTNLIELGLPPRVTRFVYSFLRNRTFAIRVDGQQEGCFTSNRGVPQGSVLAPLLFNIALIPLAWQLHRVPDVKFLVYADDVTLWTTHKDLSSQATSRGP